MVNWNGTFALKKSIGTVTYIPVSRMTPRDWRWLEFDNTRTVSQNRIASLIMQGSLVGFFQVFLLQKKKAKEEYFWPAAPKDAQDFAETNDTSFFRHTKEVDSERDALVALNNMRVSMFPLSLTIAVGILEIVERVAQKEESKEQLSHIESDLLAELNSDDLTLLMSIVMMWELSLDEAERMLDEMPGSDEADDVRDWVNDMVNEVQRARDLTTASQSGKIVQRGESLHVSQV